MIGYERETFTRLITSGPHLSFDTAIVCAAFTFQGMIHIQQHFSLLALSLSPAARNGERSLALRSVLRYFHSLTLHHVIDSKSQRFLQQRLFSS